MVPLAGRYSNPDEREKLAQLTQLVEDLIG